MRSLAMTVLFTSSIVEHTEGDVAALFLYEKPNPPAGWQLVRNGALILRDVFGEDKISVRSGVPRGAPIILEVTFEVGS